MMVELLAPTVKSITLSACWAVCSWPYPIAICQAMERSGVLELLDGSGFDKMMGYREFKPAGDNG